MSLRTEAVIMSPGDRVFLQIPTAEGAPLHRGRVVEGVRGGCMAAFEGSAVCPAAGQEVLVYHEPYGEFVRQPARIRTVISREPRSVLGLEITGEPVSAERRREHRVSYLHAYDAIVREKT